MRLLITGASGLLGGMIVYKARAMFEVFACTRHHPLRPLGFATTQVDLSDTASFRAAARQFRPQWILHAAAETDVDRCQRRPDLAHLANVVATETVAQAADESDARLLLISTDSVFDGERGRYAEVDMPNPVNKYAASKLQAERQATMIVPDTLIVRTNLYGWNIQPKTGLAEWALFALRRGERVHGWNDVFFTPIFSADLCNLLLAMMERRLSGVYHVCGAERCSKFEFLRALARTWELDTNQVVSTSMGEMPAPRPRDTSLRCDKLPGDLGRSLPGLESGLSNMRAWETSDLRAFKALLAS